LNLKGECDIPCVEYGGKCIWECPDDSKGLWGHCYDNCFINGLMTKTCNSPCSINLETGICGRDCFYGQAIHPVDGTCSYVCQMRSPDLEKRCGYPCYADNEKDICIFKCDKSFSEYDGKCVSDCINKYPNQNGICEDPCINYNGSCSIECRSNSSFDENSKRCVFECEENIPDIYGRCEIPCFTSFGKDNCTINCGNGFVAINRRCVYSCVMKSPNEEGLCDGVCMRRGDFCTEVSIINFY
jgi:hypothetical protein